MIITRTPVRISFLGGGTDYPEHFLRHGGQTLGAAIDKFSYITVNRMADLFDYAIRVGYSRTELARSPSEIEHPSVRECLRFLGVDGGIEINYVGDLPARTGLGSSSSFTVGFLHALHAFKGKLVSREQLADEAVYVEQQLIGERVGVQDQHICAHGGLVHVRCGRDGVIRVSPVPLGAERMAAFESRLMLFYTGIVRHAHEVLEEQLDRTKKGALTDDLGALSDLVDEGLKVLSGDGPISGFGELLHEAWMTKRKLSSKITNPEIDEYYERALSAGAAGGKLLGAGGGGFLLVFAEPERQEAVERVLTGLKRVRFSIERGGSSILFYHA